MTISLKYQKRILNFLHIKSAEIVEVGLAALYTFFIGTIQSFIIVVPLALFLARYNTDLLPYIYIATAFAVLFSGTVFSYFEKRMPLLRLLAVILILSATSLAIFWLALISSDHPWITLAALVWGLVLFSFTSMMLGCLNNQLFTLQQGKRIYGLFAAAQGIGGITAGFLVPILVIIIGTKSILLLTAFCFLITLFIQIAIKNRYAERFLSESPLDAATDAIAPLSVLSVIKKPFILLIFLFTASSIFTYCSLDLLFNTMAQNYYISEAKLASFLGVFYAMTDVLNVIVGTTLFNWLLKRFGIIIALLLSPCIIGTLIVLAYLANFIPTTLALVFFTVIIARLMLDTLDTSVGEQSVLLLFQPLKKRERIWAQIQREMKIMPTATGIVGLFLLFIGNFYEINISHFAYLLAFFCSLSILLLSAIRKQYLKALMTALSNRFLIKPDFSKIDKDTLLILRNHLKSNYPEEIIYVLNTIEQLNNEDFFKELIPALTHPSIEVRRYALSKIEQYRIAAALPEIQKICMNEHEPTLLENAFIALAAIGDMNTEKLLLNNTANTSIPIRLGSLVGLIKYGSPSLQAEATTYITQFANSENQIERTLAAQVMQKIQFSGAVELLQQLIKDNDLIVRVAACKAASTFQEAILYPMLIENLSIPRVHEAAFTALRAQDDNIMPLIKENFDFYPTQIQYELVKLVGKILHQDSIDFLLRYIDHPNNHLVQEVLLALRQQHYHIPFDQNHTLQKNMSREITYITQLHTLLQDFIINEHTTLLLGLIIREIQLSQNRIFSILSFYYPEDTILATQHGFETDNTDMNSYAIETLIRIFNVDDSKKILPLLTLDINELISQEFVEKNNSDDQQFLRCLEKLLLLEPQYYISELKSAIIFTIALLKYKPLLQQIKLLATKFENDALLQETYRWALPQLA